MLIRTNDLHQTMRRRLTVICVAVFCGFDLPGVVFAQNAPAPAKSAEDRANPETEKTVQPDSAAETKIRKQKVQAAFYLLGGIAFVGILTILGVVLWGMRVRRRARERAKPAPPPDPLWYLRKGAKDNQLSDGGVESESESN